MHLAIKAAEELNNSRPVRSLLFNGSPTDIKDNEGRRPIDIAKTIENPKLKLEIYK